MNSVKCPVCHGAAVPIYRTKLAGDPWMYRCAECDHCAAQPMPATLATDYSDAYTAGGEASRKNRRLAPDYLRKIRPFLPSARLRFLEVGGSHGWLAQAVRDECGADVVLLEPGRSAVDAARERGLAAECGFLGGFAPGKTFDVVFASHVIEHVADAGEFLAQCASLLSPGGVLIILTPNAAAWKFGRFGRHWAWAVPQDHTLFLSRASAGLLVEALGLELVALRGCVPGLAHYPYFLVRWLSEIRAPRVVRWFFLLIERPILGAIDFLAGPDRADELLVVARRPGYSQPL
jgi:2-polyprenyl-3-methyl-5-hydroxy-6-metoxy-1,4-benzoquinol methylase